MAKTLAAAGITLASLAATAVFFSPVASAETCKASYYSGGGTTASGEPFDPNTNSRDRNRAGRAGSPRRTRRCRSAPR